MFFSKTERYRVSRVLSYYDGASGTYYVCDAKTGKGTLCNSLYEAEKLAKYLNMQERESKTKPRRRSQMKVPIGTFCKNLGYIESLEEADTLVML